MSEPEITLIVMRLVDMTRVHPEQITAKCSLCGEVVAVYPSGQKVMRQYSDVRLICQVCKSDGNGKHTCGVTVTGLAPGAELEPFQSVKVTKQ